MRQAKQSLIRSPISPLLLLEFEAQCALLLKFEAVQAEVLSCRCAWSLVIDEFFSFRLGVQL